ncbi:MAG: efflux RND transporter periplasmic adaptor subunit [Armatimonadetes bacterium]|nr:efflux RND transporter periplasmic adaptor subunit [Armatimonadota bacterium]
MPEHIVSRSKNWVLILSLLAMAITFLVVRWVVVNNRHVGSMTPFEAQAMDMTAMKSPPGVQPVGAEEVSSRGVGGEESFPGTVMAFSDEDVVARIPGRVVAVPVYPGDSVRAGQLLARLEADEYATQAAQAGLEGKAGLAMVTVAEMEVSRLRAARERAAVESGAMSSAERQARAERTTVGIEAIRAREEVKAKHADVDEMEADLTYADQKLERQQRLYEADAISLDDLQAAKAARDAQAAKVRSANADVLTTAKAADAAQSRILAADSAVSFAVGNHAAARKRVAEADREIAKAQAEVAARRAEAKAVASGAGSARIISGYRQLRALDDAVVSERLVSPGSLVQPGQTVMKLKVVDRVRVQAQIPSRLVGRLKVGSPVQIESGKLTRRGTITSIFPAAETSTRTFTAEAVIGNPDRALVPGSFAKVSIGTGAGKRGIAVRESAIHRDADGGKFVWVVAERKGDVKTDWTCTMHPEVSSPGPGACPICKMELTPRQAMSKAVAARWPVATGSADGEYVSVLTGLKNGDRVIYAGHENLIEGTPIQVVPWEPDGPKQLPKGSNSPGPHEGH